MSTNQRNIALENEIVTLLGQGDKKAISLLYQHYAGALFGIVRRMIPSQEVAEEVLQDVFVKVWDNADKYDQSKGRLYTWLAQITRNTSLDRVRSATYRKGRKTDEMDSSVYNDEALTEPTHIQDSGLRKVVDGLDGKYRTLINYAYYQGYSQSEIAKELDMPLGTVKTRLRSAVQELRQLLNKEIIAILLIMEQWFR